MSFTAYAIGMTILGPSWAFIARDYLLSPAEVGLLASIVGIGFCSTLLGGVASDRAGKKAILCSGLGLAAVGQLTIGLSPSVEVFAVGLFAAGIGSGLFEAAVNPLVSDMFPSRKGFALNSMHLFWGVGAFMGPMIAGTILSTLGLWRVSFLVGSAVLAASALAFLATPLGSSRSGEASDLRRILQTLRSRSLVSLGLACAIIWGAEIALATWFVLFTMRERGFGLTEASYTLAAMGAAMALGRLLWSLTSDKLGNILTVQLCGAAAGLLVASASSIHMAPATMALFFLSALFYSGGVPTIIAVACAQHPASSGLASGAMLFAGNLGGILLPAMVGLIAQGATIYSGILVVSLLLFAVPVFTLRLRKARVSASVG